MTAQQGFEAIDNFRDFGGYAAGDRRLKTGLLYRSAHHARATEADLQALGALDIALVVDLRRASERVRDPSRRPPGFRGTVIENNAPEEREDDWGGFVEAADLSVEAFRRFMLEYYREAPFTTRHRDLYSRYFRALADADGPVLVHCAAGKDRTGILCALTHHLAGVHKDDALADYLLTNAPGRMEARLPAMRERLRETTGQDVSDEALLVVLGVSAELLDQAYQAMTEAHGSLDGYLEGALGLDAALRGRLHEKLLG